MKTYPLSDLVALARAECPYYRELYAAVPTDPTLADLPVVDPLHYWAAHQRDRREILTEPLTHGIVLNSGGSTGAPKFSYLTEEESKSNVEICLGAFEAALQPGDRVANLFAAGALYASFLFAVDLLRAAQADVLHLPIGYFNPIPDTARLVRLFNVNVLAGVPTHLLNLVEHLEKEGLGGVNIRTILYAGESFTSAQFAYLRGLFPDLAIRSGGYASVDAGAIAYADISCAPGEHRVTGGAIILEILDEESGQPIDEVDQPGRVIFTNLTRQLMPILRYPAGDRAMWLEPPGAPQRKFRLLGRAGDSVRIASANVRLDDVRALLEPLRPALGLTDFQLLVTAEEDRDCLTLRLAATADAAARATGTSAILEGFARGHPLLVKMIAADTARPTRLEWITPRELIVSERTGKTLPIVDRRLV